MPVRCHQCKTELLGGGTGRQHAQLTKHVWQPGYYCKVCEATFSSHSACKTHEAKCQSASQNSAGSAASANPSIATLAEYRTSVSNIVTCPECKEHFRDSETLALHRAEHQTQVEPTASSSKSTARYPCGVDPILPAFHRKAVSPCDICAVCIPHEMMSLQDHFRQSTMHPKCRGCGLGFATLWDWTDHRHRCTAPIPKTIPPVPAQSATNASLYAAAIRTQSEVHVGDCAGTSKERTPSLEPGPSPARASRVLTPDIPTPPVGSIVQEIASTLSTAFSTLGSVSYVVHDPESPTTLQNIPPILEASPCLEFDLQLPDSPARTAFNPIATGSPKFHKSPRSEHRSLSPKHEEEPELDVDVDAEADADVGSTAERSSLIAKAALDLIAQRFGAHAAERVVRVMQALGAAPAEGELELGLEPEPVPKDVVLDGFGGATSTQKRAPMLVSVLNPDEGTVCSTGRTSPSEVGIASPCSPSCAVSPPDAVVDDAGSEAETEAEPEVENKVASVYQTPVPTRTPSPLALSIHSTPSTLASAETKAESVLDVAASILPVKAPKPGGLHATRTVVEPPLKTKARAPTRSLSWHCRSCERDPDAFSDNRDGAVEYDRRWPRECARIAPAAHMWDMQLCLHGRNIVQCPSTDLWKRHISSTEGRSYTPTCFEWQVHLTSVPTPAIPWQHATSTVGQTSKAHLVCHQCQQKFNGKKNMRRHGTESGHQWQPSVRCSACFKAFNTRLEFKAHVPQVSCLDAPMIRLLRSKPAVGAIPASTELQACQSMGDPPRSEGTAIVDANNDTSSKACTTCGSVFTDAPSFSEHQRTCGKDSSLPQVAPALEIEPVAESEAKLALPEGSVSEAVVMSLCTAFSSLGSVSYRVESIGESDADSDGDEDDTRPIHPEAGSIRTSQPLTGGTIQQNETPVLSSSQPSTAGNLRYNPLAW
ncbi:hypothetical protein ONZ51_g445 [Trametes cubensis]|uniref:C2H2-type domain-containing protein n=1 Tax=Trametes cubensis TaxID=1111947 RepID=A0AAD7U3D0_9APHY|nr:hypothetical protein ONZ51_g445 [Trametes cubensis]